MHTQRRMGRSIRGGPVAGFQDDPRSRDRVQSQQTHSNHAMHGSRSTATESVGFGGQPRTAVGQLSLTRLGIPARPTPAHGRCRDEMRPRNLTAGGTMVSCGASAAITSQWPPR
jgi:hypothetical protein